MMFMWRGCNDSERKEILQFRTIFNSVHIYPKFVLSYSWPAMCKSSMRMHDTQEDVSKDGYLQLWILWPHQISVNNFAFIYIYIYILVSKDQRHTAANMLSWYGEDIKTPNNDYRLFLNWPHLSHDLQLNTVMYNTVWTLANVLWSVDCEHFKAVSLCHNHTSLRRWCTAVMIELGL